MLIDAENIYLAFTHINAGGMPLRTWKDKRPNVFQTQQVVKYATDELGLDDPFMLSLPVRALDIPRESREPTIRKAALEYVELILRILTRPKVLPGFEGMQSLLDRFMQDHPDFDKNVFVAMRFRSATHFEKLYTSLREGLAAYGLKVHRADEKIYAIDGDLWNNVCVYMMGCKYGICVFEEMDEREFNPNVALEYGFMRAMNRQVLLLKEQRMQRSPSDITGKLYKPFDMMDIEASVRTQSTRWAERDLSLQIA